MNSYHFPRPSFQEEQEWEARILANAGSLFAGLHRTKKRAKPLFDEAIKRFRGSRNVQVRRIVADTYFRASELFLTPNFPRTKKGWREARRAARRRFAYLDAMLAWLRAPSDPELRAWVARVLVIKGAALMELQRQAEAADVFGRALAFVTEDDELVTRVHAARAAWMQGEMFKQLKRPAKALAAFEKGIARFGDDPAPEIQDQVSRMLYLRGRALFLLDRHSEALDAFDVAIAAVRRQRRGELLTASLGKLDTLVAAKRHLEALALCADVMGMVRRLKQPDQRARAYTLKAAACRGLGKLAAARRADRMAKRIGKDS